MITYDPDSPKPKYRTVHCNWPTWFRDELNLLACKEGKKVSIP